MAKIDPTGIVPTELSEYLAALRVVWNTVFGTDLNFDADTPQGEITGADALSLAQMDEVLVDLADSLDIFQAGGQQLDDLCAILAILRKGAVNSNVNAELTGSPLAVIPAGSQAKLTTGEIFELQSDVALDGSGEGSGFFLAADTGAIAVPVNTLTSLISQVAGWETIDNATQGATGVPKELDFVYRRRYFATLAINAVTPIDAIVAGVFSLENVTDAAGFENDTSAPVITEGVSIPAHSVAISVVGGDDDEIGERIRVKKTLGCGTDGDVTVVVPVFLPNTDTKIQDLSIKFYRVASVPIKVDVELEVNSAFPTDGEQRITNDLLAYFNGGDQFTSDFELDGLQIAEDVNRSRLYTPVNRTQGHAINFLKTVRVTYSDWLIGTAYVIGDIVESTVDNNDYICTADNTGNEPSVSGGFWSLVDSVEILPINLNEKATLDENDITITTI